MESPTLRRVPHDNNSPEMSDKYTASIELSNACRHFYNSRIEAAANMKIKLQKRILDKNDQPSVTKKRWGINEAMDRLREEMVSLMDQDLTLMKQLLNLNETIEDLKWQRSNYYSGASSEESDFSVSETEMYADSSDSDVPHWKSKKPVPISNYKRSEETATITPASSCKGYVQTSFKMIPQTIVAETRISTQMTRSITNLHKGHIEYRSFDSGINEADHVEIRV